MSPLPLADLTVIEIASFIAGPSAGLAMSQLGANVVRIDPASGAADVNRWPVNDEGRSIYWSSLNRGKRSVEIDLRADAGRDLVRRMICAPGTGRGILVDNQPNADWLSWPELSARRADLIHVHIDGHRDGRPAVDYTVNAEVGIPLVTGPADGSAGPVNHVLPAWDLLCGMSVVTAVLAALRHRDITGEGARIDLALADVALASIANMGWYTEATRGVARLPIGNAIYGSFGQSFTSRDGRHVMVVALTPSQWRAVVTMTDTAAQMAAIEAEHSVDLTEDEAARYVHRDALTAVLTGWFAERTYAEITDALSSARVLSAPYRTLAEAAANGGPLTELTQPGIGTVTSAASPFRWHGLETSNGPASALGADTAQTLRDLAHVSDAELEELAAAGVIAGGGSS